MQAVSINEDVPYHFDDVTLLVTHYNRSNSLERLLKTFKELNCSFKNIVVSDDGSKPEHQARLKELEAEYRVQLIMATKNRGLGNNINKGQDAVQTPLTLYVQEDFVPTRHFLEPFKNAVTIMRNEPGMDFIRFYSYLRYPYTKPYSDGFLEMILPSFALDYKKIYAYSDHPHLRRSSFLLKFGRYAEGLKGDRTEYRMCISFIQKKGKGLIYEDYQKLFLQKNSSDEPSTMIRDNWKQSNNPFISFIRYIYRQVKYNYDILFLKV